MRYHIRQATDLKFGMDVDVVNSNAHAKNFFSRSTHLGAGVIDGLPKTSTASIDKGK